MARRRSKSYSYNNRPQGGRGYTTPQPLTLRLHPLPPSLGSLQRARMANAFRIAYPKRALPPSLRDYEDRRTFHPAGIARPALTTGVRSAAKLIVSPKSLLTARIPSSVRFADPRRVLICLRRKIRKEVLMAGGKGGSKVKRPKRNQFSEVSC